MFQIFSRKIILSGNVRGAEPYSFEAFVIVRKQQWSDLLYPPENFDFIFNLYNIFGKFSKEESSNIIEFLEIDTFLSITQHELYISVQSKIPTGMEGDHKKYYTGMELLYDTNQWNIV